MAAEPYCTREQVTEIYAETLRRIARQEDVNVLVVPGSNLGNLMRSQAVASERRRYMSDIQSFVAKHHFLWVDPAPALGGFQGGMAGVESDDVHSTLEVQKLVGEYVAAAYLNTQADRPEPANSPLPGSRLPWNDSHSAGAEWR